MRGEKDQKVDLWRLKLLIFHVRVNLSPPPLFPILSILFGDFEIYYQFTKNQSVEIDYLMKLKKK